MRRDGEGRALYLEPNGSFFILGHGVNEPQATPKRVEGLGGAKVAAVALSGFHTLAVDEDGVVWAFGMRSSLGLDDPNLDPEDAHFVKTPTRIPTLRVRARTSSDMLPFY